MQMSTFATADVELSKEDRHTLMEEVQAAFLEANPHRESAIQAELFRVVNSAAFGGAECHVCPYRANYYLQEAVDCRPVADGVTRWVKIPHYAGYHSAMAQCEICPYCAWYKPYNYE